MSVMPPGERDLLPKWRHEPAARARVLTLDSEHHYWLDGMIEIPSVSEVLKKAGLTTDFSKIPPAVLERKRNIGIALHKAAEYLIEGTLDRSSLDFALLPYFKGLESFFVKEKPQVIEYEKMGWHEDLMVAGTWDLKCRIGGRLTRPDYKTTYSKSPTWPIQLALYDLIDETTDRMVIWLRKDGTYQLLPYQDEADYDIATAACRMYHWRKSKALL